MRALILTVMLSLLSGCQARPEAPLPEAISPEPYADLSDWLNKVISPKPRAELDDWLNEVNRLLALTEEQAQAELQQLSRSNTGQPKRQFRYALLNQQLKDRLGWIRARDSLQRLSTNSGLSEPLLQLVRLLQFHNQSMINADARQARLLSALEEGIQKQLTTAAALQLSQQQVIELSEKIQALTNLEKNMSIRRALTTEPPGEPAND